MDWEKYKEPPNKIAVYCENKPTKEQFFKQCRRHGILPNLSKFAIDAWSYYACVRSNGRLELMAFSSEAATARGYNVITYETAEEVRK